MFNRTAEYIAHGARSLTSPLYKLHSDQRARIEKSSKKVGKVLGEMPIIDIIPASPRSMDTPSLSMGQEKQDGKSGKKGKRTKNQPPPAPILRYKLNPLARRASVRRASRFGTESSVRKNRKPVPNELNLGTAAWRTAANTLSPLPTSQVSPYSAKNSSQGAIFLSPLSPLSPFSPIETSDMREQKYIGLRRLARVSRAFRDTIIEELPVFAQSAQDVENVNSYLDLYRIATHRQTRDSGAFAALARLDTATYSACNTARTDVNTAYTAYVSGSPISRRRRSASLSTIQRRSVSSMTSATPMARTSFIVPHSASVYSFQDSPVHARFTLVIRVPSPRTPMLAGCTSAASVYSTSSRTSYTLVLNVPADLRRSPFPETPADDDAPLQKQQKEARVLAKMLSGVRPLAIAAEEAGDDARSPSTAAPTPVTKGRSPRVPYWVRSSYYRVSAHGYVRRTHSYGRRGGVRVPPTPGTIRRERRQGWGGEWKVGRMAAAMEGLKALATPAPPRVPEKEREVPAVPPKERVALETAAEDVVDVGEDVIVIEPARNL